MYNGQVNYKKGEFILKKIISLLLVLVMMFSLTSCGKVTMDDISKDTNMVVGKIGEEDVYAYEVIYYLKMGSTKEQAVSALAEAKILKQEAIKNSIEYNSDMEAQVTAMIDQLKQQFETEEEMNASLSDMGITLEQYTNLLKLVVHAQSYVAVMPEKGLIKSATDEETKAFFDENVMKAKHILLSTIEPTTGLTLSEADQAKAKETAEDIVTNIKAGAPFEDFEKLNEDPGATQAPEGYVFVRTKNIESDTLKSIFSQIGLAMVEPFEDATAELKVDEVSGIVPTDYGYHIIKRVALTDEDYETYKETCRNALTSLVYEQMLEDWKANDYKVEMNEKALEAIEVEPVQG